MAKSATMHIRIDPQVMANVKAIYSQYGMSIADAVNIFLYASQNIGGLPFNMRPSVINAETAEAIKEGDRMIKSGRVRFNNADDMLLELKS